MATTINTHGINIDLDSLRSAARLTKGTGPEVYQIISFDRETGEVHLWEGTNNNWVDWRDPAVIEVSRGRHHHPAQWIADRIAEVLRETEAG